MKNIKKILTGTLISAISLTAIGCSSNNNNLAKNIDKSMADFVSSINSLDYVDTNKPTTDKIGKIVETNANISNYNFADKKQSNKRTITSTGNTISFFNDNVSEAEIENTITRPTERLGDFNLFVLSDVPFITMTSDDNQTSLTLNVKFSTNKIEETSYNIDTKFG